MQMQLGIESQIPEGLLAANALLAENSRQGVPTSTQALYPGFEFAISSTYKGFQFRCSESASDPVVAPNNPTLMNVSQTTPCSATPSNAFTLNYSPDVQDHIMQRHGNSGLPGVSQYFGNFFQIQNINAFTFLFGSQAQQGNRVVFQYTFPQILAPFATTHIGTDATGQHTSTNRLVTGSDCKTVVTSYPIGG
jgi:hypothetical protein